MQNRAVSILASSFSLVAASEMGDKTQLLAFSLAARFKKPWPILAGILVATTANHALAAAFGQWLAHGFDPHALGLAIGVVFIGFGLWMLKPDQADETKDDPRFGPFVTTVVLFFLAEMGDKTQLATLALGARFHSWALVTLGTTAAMLAADGLAVFLGDRLAHRVQMNWIRWLAAILFIGFGIASILTSR